MPFDAGAIVGKLGLDPTDFHAVMTNAGEHAEMFGVTVGPRLTAAMRMAGDALKAGADLAWQAVTDSAQRWDDMGEAAEKAGVSTQFLSTVGRLADDAGSSVQGLSLGMKFLNDHAANAAAGSKSSQQAFADLGVAYADASGKIKPAEQLFFEVADALSRVENGSEKVRLASNLLGAKLGPDLIPMMNMGAEGIRNWQNLMIALGADVTAEEARIGGSFKTMETVANAAIDGIKEAFARPILSALSKEINENQEDFVQLAKRAQETAETIGWAAVKAAEAWSKHGDTIKMWFGGNAGSYLLDWGTSGWAESDAEEQLGYAPYDPNSKPPTTTKSRTAPKSEVTINIPPETTPDRVQQMQTEVVKANNESRDFMFYVRLAAGAR